MVLHCTSSNIDTTAMYVYIFHQSHQRKHRKYVCYEITKIILSRCKNQRFVSGTFEKLNQWWLIEKTWAKNPLKINDYELDNDDQSKIGDSNLVFIF